MIWEMDSLRLRAYARNIRGEYMFSSRMKHVWSKIKKGKIALSFASPEKKIIILYITLWLWSKKFINAPLITTDWLREMRFNSQLSHSSRVWQIICFCSCKAQSCAHTARKISVLRVSRMLFFPRRWCMPMHNVKSMFWYSEFVNAVKCMSEKKVKFLKRRVPINPEAIV